MLRPFLIVALALTALPAAAQLATPNVAAANPADAAFRALADAEWKWRQAQFRDEGESGVAARLPDIGPAAQARRAAYWSDVAKRLDALDQGKLSAEARVDFQVYRAQIARQLDDQKFREFELPLNSDSAFWSDIQYTARNDFRRGEPDYRAYLKQLADLPRYFDQQTANMAAGLARGFTPPKAIMAGRDASIAAIAEASDPAKIVFFEPFTKLPASMPIATRETLKREARLVIAQKVIPAYAKLLKYYRETYYPGMRADLAAENYRDGKAYYASRIRVYTTTDLSADAIHRIGLSEVAKIKARMGDTMRATGFKGTLPEFLVFLKTDPQFYVTTPQALLDRAAWTAKEFDRVAARWFGRLPRGRFGIVEVPPDIAPYYTAGRGGAGGYLLNTYDLPSRPLYSLPALTLHESAPGHSWQISLSNENIALPAWRRYDYISAYGEGWALYTELLGEEMGMYKSPYELFGMLSYQMWRACRLVIDTGIHAKGWTREQGLAFMRDNTALSEREVTTEVDRYIGWPGQALSYYLGELEIVKARKKAEAALGAKFDIRAFHDTVLSLGSVPLPVLSSRVDRFIAEGGKGPYADERRR
ncbi:MAG: DUF885 family protein [Pseudomonadota bacterium]